MFVQVTHAKTFIANDEILDDLVEWLQQVSKAILTSLLTSQTPTPEGLFAQLPLIRFFEQIRQHPLPTVEQQLDWMTVSDGVKQFLQRKQQNRIWHTYFATRVIKSLHIDPAFHIPATLWHMVGIRAWREPRFRREIAQMVEYYFRRKVLFRVGEFVTIQLSPNTYWLLLAMSCAVATLDSKSRIPVSRNDINFIQEVAQTIGLQPAYADLWDQWVLIQARHAWDIKRISAQIVDRIDALPLYQNTSESKQADATNLAMPDWNDSVPTWFSEWFRETYLS